MDEEINSSQADEAKKMDIYMDTFPRARIE
jgi:hypothetical protein